MIAEFLASWSLFATTYLVGWLAAVTLALVGVWVVAQNQIFLGAAVSQASALGVAVALLLAGEPLGGHVPEEELLAVALAVAASVATALLAGRRAEPGRETPEATMGWVFLLGGSVPVLMVAHSPHGLEEVQRTLFSTVLGATRADLAAFALLAAGVAAVAAALRRPVLLLAMDPEMAAAVGLRPARAGAAASVLLGVTVGLAIRSTGMLYTFGCLVLPALVAKNLTREYAPVFWTAPALALGAAVSGFVLAHHWDLPPGQTTVALLCALLPPAWAFARLRGSG